MLPPVPEFVSQWSRSFVSGGFHPRHFAACRYDVAESSFMHFRKFSQDFRKCAPVQIPVLGSILRLVLVAD